MKAYKIRSKKNGTFTEGGRYAEGKFDERGKIWWSPKEMLAFLRYYIRDQTAFREYEKSRGNDLDKKLGPIVPEDWEIVEFDMEEKSTRTVYDFLKEHKLAK